MSDEVIHKEPVYIFEHRSEPMSRGRIIKITAQDGSFYYIIQTKFLWWWYTYKNSYTESDHVYETLDDARIALSKLTRSRKKKKEIVEYLP